MLVYNDTIDDLILTPSLPAQVIAVDCWRKDVKHRIGRSMVSTYEIRRHSLRVVARYPGSPLDGVGMKLFV
jgi:hypothetical protein